MARDALATGAANAIRTCLAVKPGERVILVTDEPQREVGDALEHACRDLGVPVERFVLERLGPRPLAALPDAVREAAARSQVSLWAASSAKGELPVRMEYRKLVKHARHAHMPGITRTLMETGMAADYAKVSDLTLRVHAIARRARTARVRGEGVSLDATFDPDWRWLTDTGLFHRAGEWGNLPAGETYTAPASLEGTITTPLLGDWLSERFGLLDPPLSFEVRDSRVVLDSLRGGTPEARAAFRDYLLQDPNGTRAGEFAVGTNLALARLVGNLLQDEKFPGVHVAFGHPYAEETGAPWTAKTHIDVILPGVSLWFDSTQVLEGGRFVV